MILSRPRLIPYFYLDTPNIQQQFFARSHGHSIAGAETGLGQVAIEMGPI